MLPWAEANAKAEALLGQMTQDEKYSLMKGIGWSNYNPFKWWYVGNIPAVSRLGSALAAKLELRLPLQPNSSCGCPQTTNSLPRMPYDSLPRMRSPFAQHAGRGGRLSAVLG